MGRENDYQVKILSNLDEKTKNKNYINKIHPWFITGFTDAEGSFMIKLSKTNCKWKIQLDFTIGLHVSDLELLKEIKLFFDNVGQITYNKRVAIYSVRSLKEILNHIIPHFDKYSLCSHKKADFLLFKSAAYIMKTKNHLTEKGLQQIINLRASLNKGLNNTLKTAFPNTVPEKRPSISKQ
jgi:hypothetical protein